MEFTDFSKTSFYYPSSQSVWDFGDLAAAERNSLGFMDLLGSQPQYHDFPTVSPHSLPQHQSQTQTQLSTKLSSPVSTILQAPPPSHNASTAEQLVASKVESLCSDHFLTNPPATPNSSISSASSEALNDEKPKREDNDGEEEDEQDKSHTNKQLKPKKKNNQKREREARVAFMTKSEVDHLEDGYRWRKYGQKAVKNSPFPRSYYRCTTASCNVKKRVERSFRDPSTVVTTYEGQHTHISPLTSRPISTGGFYGSSGAASNLGNGCFGFPVESSALISPQFQQLVHYHQQQELLSCFGGANEYLNSHANEYGDEDRVKKSRSLVKDYGLLQDVVPSHMLKE
ncbi:hypothetical protein CARUB_v10023565mg [Capsella rubella]|uniref:WRKY domain-containing protein n=1 Tax=Capsella rubella TaxID=81985 RepID=R0HQZ6_9BRAS|nr:probable WRKY transcription factor 23 [Capsella rubella]EOA26398.1 hypothetical protein CARUB_v10023565mg [Capsella rubella]